MKTCPYAISGLLSQSEFVSSVLDGCTPVKDYSTLVACREEDCGRYALCNPQSPKDQQKEKEHRIYAIAFSLFTREKNIVLRVLEKYGPEAVERMCRDDWLKQRDCGAKSVENILAALHGHKEGES